jgi:hypothetical protein
MTSGRVEARTGRASPSRRSDCGRISKRFLEKERRALGPRFFAQEYECEFHGTREALFSEDQVRRAVTGEVSPLFTNAVAESIPPGPPNTPLRGFSAATISSALTSASAAITAPSR